MDASVNMKMSPEEHRLIRECVMEEADRLNDSRTNSTLAAPVRNKMRERENKLRDLLAKL